ncbi:MAG: hypothetical protein RLN62_04425 [Rickettsiales bacterium]
MIGHFVAVPFEFAIKYGCELITQPFTYEQQKEDTISSDKQCDANEQWYQHTSTVGCTAASKVAHEVIEYAVDQIPIYFGVKLTLDALGAHRECDHGMTPSLIGATMGAFAEIIFDQHNILYNAAIGYAVNLVGTLGVDEMMHRMGDHHDHFGNGYTA